MPLTKPTIDDGYLAVYRRRFTDLMGLTLETELPRLFPDIGKLVWPTSPEDVQLLELAASKHEKLKTLRRELSVFEGNLRRQLVVLKKPLTDSQRTKHHALEVSGTEAFEEFAEELAGLFSSTFLIPRELLIGPMTTPFARRGASRGTPVPSLDAALALELRRSTADQAAQRAKAVADLKERILDADLDALAGALFDLLPTAPALRPILSL